MSGRDDGRHTGVVTDIVDPEYPDLVGIVGGPLMPCKVVEFVETTAAVAFKDDHGTYYQPTRRYVIRYQGRPVEISYPSGLDEAIRTWFAARLEFMPCDGDIEAHESLQMAAHTVLAVLDLHADVEDGDGTHCAHCGPREIWPCPTRRVIGERLGVGVAVEHGRP